MKKLICLVFLLGIGFGLNSMEEEGAETIKVSPDQRINAQFTGPVIMKSPTVDAGRDTISIINHYRNPDFTKGDPRASWFRQVANAAMASIPALIYETPSHVVSSLAVQVLSQTILGWINGDKTSEITSLKKLELCKKHFVEKMANISVSSPEYAEYKQKIDKIDKRESQLEKKLYGQLYDEAMGKSTLSKCGDFMGKVVNIQATKNNLNHFMKKVSLVA